MKTFHIHTKVKNLEESKNFYTVMFNSEPSVEEDNYIKGTSKNPNNLDDVRFLSYSDFFKVRCSQSYIQFKKIAIWLKYGISYLFWVFRGSLKWKLLDPAINFAISLADDKEKVGVDHFGLQTENNEELEEIHKNLEKANIKDSEQKNASCCYALSDKYWSMDPTNIPWEVFHTLDEVKTYGKDRKKFSTSSVCCG